MRMGKSEKDFKVGHENGLTISGRSKHAVKWKVLPLFSTLSTQILPPMRLTNCDEMESPNPVPPKRRVVDRSAWLKDWKMNFCFSAGMPIPVSCTAHWSCTEP